MAQPVFIARLCIAAMRIHYAYLEKVVLREAPILFGIGLVEHQYHDTARIEAVRPEDIESREAELLCRGHGVVAQAAV